MLSRTPRLAVVKPTRVPRTSGTCWRAARLRRCHASATFAAARTFIPAKCPVEALPGAGVSGYDAVSVRCGGETGLPVAGTDVTELQGGGDHDDQEAGSCRWRRARADDGFST